MLHDANSLTHSRNSGIRGYLASKFATKCMGFKVALLGADPHPMQLPLKAVPQKHCTVCPDVSDVPLIFGCKQSLVHALLECAVTASQKSVSNADETLMTFAAPCLLNKTPSEMSAGHITSSMHPICNCRVCSHSCTCSVCSHSCNCSVCSHRCDCSVCSHSHCNCSVCSHNSRCAGSLKQSRCFAKHASTSTAHLDQKILPFLKPSGSTKEAP